MNIFVTIESGWYGGSIKVTRKEPEIKCYYITKEFKMEKEADSVYVTCCEEMYGGGNLVRPFLTSEEAYKWLAVILPNGIDGVVTKINITNE